VIAGCIAGLALAGCSVDWGWVFKLEFTNGIALPKYHGFDYSVCPCSPLMSIALQS